MQRAVAGDVATRECSKTYMIELTRRTQPLYVRICPAEKKKRSSQTGEERNIIQSVYLGKLTAYPA